MSDDRESKLQAAVDRLNQCRKDEEAAKERLADFRLKKPAKNELNRAIEATMTQQVHALSLERNKLEREVGRLMASNMRDDEIKEEQEAKAMELLAQQGEAVPYEVARLNIGRRVLARVTDDRGTRWSVVAIDNPGSKRCQVKVVSCGTVYSVAYDRIRDLPSRNPGPMLKPVPKPQPVIVKVGEETMQERQVRTDDRDTNEKRAAIAAAQAVLAETTDLNELAERVKDAAASVKQAEADVKVAEGMVKDAQARVVAERQAMAAARDALQAAVQKLATA